MNTSRDALILLAALFVLALCFIVPSCGSGSPAPIVPVQPSVTTASSPTASHIHPAPQGTTWVLIATATFSGMVDTSITHIEHDYPSAEACQAAYAIFQQQVGHERVEGSCLKFSS